MSTEIAQLLEEYGKNYPFWAGEMFFIRDKANNLHTLELNHVQQQVQKIEEEEMRLRGEVRLYILKGRQGGISTDQQARALHMSMFTPGANSLTLAHSRDDTDKIFQITKRAVRELIERFKPLLPTIGKSEAKEVTFPEIDSNFWTGTAGARRIGRGITLTRFHGSEFAFWDKPKQVIASVTPALIPHGSVVVLETTPDMEGSEAHEFWKEAVDGKNGYRAVFFPWWECDPVNYRRTLTTPDELGELDREEFTLIQKHGLTLENIKWRRQQIKQLGKMEFIREYPEDSETCWITGGQKFYNSEIIWDLLHKAPKPLEKIPTPYGGVIQVFDHQEVEIELPGGGKGKVKEDVIIGSDVSEGVGGDKTTWTARSFPSWRLLSTFSHDRIEPPDFAQLLFGWGKGYATPAQDAALLIIEKNQHGITVLRKLRDLRYPRKHIYHRTPLSKNRDEKTDYIGWATTGESKPLLLDAGRELLRAAHEGFVSNLSREALRDAWAVSDGELNGRDVLVSELLAWIAREYAVRRRIQVLAPLHW